MELEQYGVPNESLTPQSYLVVDGCCYCPRGKGFEFPTDAADEEG